MLRGQISIFTLADVLIGQRVLPAVLATLESYGGAGFWPSLGLVSLLYHAACTTALGTTVGTKVVALSTQLTFSHH